MRHVNRTVVLSKMDLRRNKITKDLQKDIFLKLGTVERYILKCCENRERKCWTPLSLSPVSCISLYAISLLISRLYQSVLKACVAYIYINV